MSTGIFGAPARIKGTAGPTMKVKNLNFARKRIELEWRWNGRLQTTDVRMDQVVVFLTDGKQGEFHAL